MRSRPGEAIAPMHFPTLMAECDAPADVQAEVSDLMLRKASTRELGEAPLPARVASFIDAEFEAARLLFEHGRARLSQAACEQASVFYRTTVQRLDGAA